MAASAPGGADAAVNAMSDSQQVVLIAAPSLVNRKLEDGLDDQVEVVAAETYDEALACLAQFKDLVFDLLRPDRGP